MIWATLALLGIPIWFIAAILVAAFRRRNAVRSDPDEFGYTLKKGDGWQRKKGYARWVSNVLIFHAGIALIRSDAVQVDMGLFGFQRGLAKSSNCWLFGNGRVLFEDDSRAQFPGQSL